MRISTWLDRIGTNGTSYSIQYENHFVVRFETKDEALKELARFDQTKWSFKEAPETVEVALKRPQPQITSVKALGSIQFFKPH